MRMLTLKLAPNELAAVYQVLGAAVGRAEPSDLHLRSTYLEVLELYLKVQLQQHTVSKKCYRLRVRSSTALAFAAWCQAVQLPASSYEFAAVQLLVQQILQKVDQLPKMV